MAAESQGKSLNTWAADVIKNAARRYKENQPPPDGLGQKRRAGRWCANNWHMDERADFARNSCWSRCDTGRSKQLNGLLRLAVFRVR
jgi:hypothetical protein